MNSYHKNKRINRKNSSIWALSILGMLFTGMVFLLSSASVYAAELSGTQETTTQKRYSILIADAKGGYTFYDLNPVETSIVPGDNQNTADSTNTTDITNTVNDTNVVDPTASEIKAASIEVTTSGSIMVPLKELTALMPSISYNYNTAKKTATVTNTVNGKKIVYTNDKKTISYYSSAKAKAVKKSITDKMYLSNQSAAVMVPMESLKWIMGTTAGFGYYAPEIMQQYGYDTFTYSGLLVYQPYAAIGELPKASKVYGISSIVKITIPEGYAAAQVFELLVKKGICTSTAGLFDAMQNYAFSTVRYPLYAAIPVTDQRCFKLEGYLYPDTYEFYLLSKPEDVIGKFLRNTEAKLTVADRQKAQELGYTMDQILTIASMIEKETADYSMMPDIASVIYNRLNIKMKLRFDSSINYVERYIKPNISGDINRYNSYYNTYKCAALPAGPICNPGKAAIRAALNPNITDFLYFYSDAAGEYHFSKEWVNPKADTAGESGAITE